MYNRYREEEKEEMERLKKEGKLDEVEESSPDNLNQANDDLDLEVDLEEQVKTYKEKYLRVLAEAENFKKRINEERIRERKYFNQSLFERLVSTIDIFDQTVNIETEDEKLKNFLIGFEMINKDLKQILADEGVKLINSVGEKFNPAYHHAMELEYHKDLEEDVIISEIQRGYMYKDRVLRVAMVKVNKKEENNKEE